MDPKHLRSADLILLPGARTGRDPARSIKPGPRRQPAGVVAATQRERLLDGLVRTVAERGYQHATVSDICRAAGVTRPVFYELFSGKEDAFLAAHRHGTGVVIRRMAAAFAAESDWCAGIRQALDAMLQLLAGTPSFATMAVIEIEAVGPAGRRAREQLLLRFRAFFADVPQLPGGVGVQETVDAVVGGVYSAVYRRISSGRTDQLTDLLPVLSMFCLAPFLGPAEADRRLGGSARRIGEDPSCTRIDPANTGQ
ncbi:TetR/AcrR family transcriptional regulator [Kitasatospora sp. NPDC096128]|uniref:TetR/AcrR family transcriptional regulator n=1 Tax=Kitasatospora sp. NPDC096128 TaxID=3155547 RepID=UPI003318CB2E